MRAKTEPTYLFVYGGLKTGHFPPATSYKVRNDTVPGFMFLRPRANDPAAVFDTDMPLEPIHGELLELNPIEFDKLDKEEAPEYKRTKQKTESGVMAWVYEYTGYVPANAKQIDRWD